MNITKTQVIKTEKDEKEDYSYEIIKSLDEGNGELFLVSCDLNKTGYNIKSENDNDSLSKEIDNENITIISAKSNEPVNCDQKNNYLLKKNWNYK